ncbi:unnamed protein product [Arctogadus glacialis]
MGANYPVHTNNKQNERNIIESQSELDPRHSSPALTDLERKRRIKEAQADCTCETRGCRQNLKKGFQCGEEHVNTGDTSSAEPREPGVTSAPVKTRAT